MPAAVRIENLDEVLRKFDEKLIAAPLKRFFERAAVTVQGKARPEAAVDMGLMRNAVVYELDQATPVLWAKVGLLRADAGSPLWKKGRAMEYGTGRMGDPAVSHAAQHFPPAAALDVWGRRHGGIPGFVVARAIARRGGLKPRPFLRPALKASMGAIKGFLAQLSREIGQNWGQ